MCKRIATHGPDSFPQQRRHAFAAVDTVLLHERNMNDKGN